MNDEIRQLWQVGAFECLMVSCCSGAELQVRRTDGAGDPVLRELYPTKSDLYDRAKDLKRDYERGVAPDVAG
ncbi:MAG TPA: hypothetical protein VH583_07740 [Vicinamibacterales bacterium]|jgi:hypothetical protein